MNEYQCDSYSRTRLNRHQVYFLRVLSEIGNLGALTKWQLLQHYSEQTYLVTDYVGVVDEQVRQRKEKRLGRPSLITLGLVDCYTIIRDLKPTPLYRITEEGRKVVELLLLTDKPAEQLRSEVKSWQYMCICDVCGNEFKSTRFDAKYCPKKCRMRAYRQRRDQ